MTYTAVCMQDETDRFADNERTIRVNVATGGDGEAYTSNAYTVTVVDPT